MRKCVGCGEMKPKRDLVRVVKAPDTKNENGEVYYMGKPLEKSGNVTDNYIYIENYGGIYLPDYSNVKYNVTDNEFRKFIQGYLDLFFNTQKT